MKITMSQVPTMPKATWDKLADRAGDGNLPPEPTNELLCRWPDVIRANRGTLRMSESHSPTVASVSGDETRAITGSSQLRCSRVGASRAA